MRNIQKNQNILHSFHKNQCASCCPPKQVFQFEVLGKLHSTISCNDSVWGLCSLLLAFVLIEENRSVERPLLITVVLHVQYAWFAAIESMKFSCLYDTLRKVAFVFNVVSAVHCTPHLSDLN